MGNKNIDWSIRMNLAIDYMESKLDDEIDISLVAKKALCSSFHFQKMFFALLGITPSEYIRNRRLTLAAMDLSNGESKIIDIALKFNYESPNSFTRAFKNVHGIKPSEVRKSGVRLFSYNRVSFHVEIKGGNRMNYKIVEKPAFEIMGKSKIFTHENFFKEAPKYWKEYVGTEEYKTLWNTTGGKCGKVSEAPLMSVYMPNEKNNSDSFTDILGVEINRPVDLKKFKSFQIPSAMYAEFQCTYQTSAKLNKQIYGEWLPSSGYERDPKKADIAAYFPAAFLPMTQMGVRWWIPILKKK